MLILGYGNVLRGDDGFGCCVVRALSAAVVDPEVDIRELHQLTPELAEPVSRAAHVVFIDAARDGPLGELRRVPVEAALAGAFTHHLTPAALLACARELYGRAPAATLFSAAGACFDYTTDLSPRLQGAVNEAVRQVLSLLQDL